MELRLKLYQCSPSYLHRPAFLSIYNLPGVLHTRYAVFYTAFIGAVQQKEGILFLTDRPV